MLITIGMVRHPRQIASLTAGPQVEEASVRIGVLTGGGDCPGLNAVIRAVVRKGERHFGDTIIGFHDGYRGLMENDWTELDVESCRGILPRGGTILGTSRIQPYAVHEGVELVLLTMS
jgi:6-phosphofructokinase 1